MGSSHLSPYEDYINMELSSSSSPQIKEFEFQFFSASAAKESAAAADLFYRGKLLPLHLPPRRQMVEHLIRTAAAASPSILGCSTAPCTTSNTPSDSRNISPSQSRRVSCDSDTTTLIRCPTQITTAFFNNNTNNNHRPTNNPSSPWSKKLKIIKMKMIKHPLLKSSRIFLKSFFAKSAACSDAENLADANKYSRIGRKFATLIKKNGTDDHRRSFSGAISADSSSSSSSSTSFNSSALHELQFLRRSSSAAEIEVSIDAAIAHCKKSMRSFELNCNLSS